MAVKPANMPFEKALERLETIVEQLESGTVPLAGAVKLFEEGIALRKRCLDLLKEAEKRVRFLSESAAGEPVEGDAPPGWEREHVDD